MQIKIVVGCQRVLFHGLEQTEVVRSEIPLELCRSLARRIERCLQIGGKALQVAGMFRQLVTIQVGCGESFLGDEHSAEVLVLERHPFNGTLHLFLLIALFFEMIAVAVAVFVRQRRIHVLKIVAFFVLSYVILPLYAESLRVARELLLKSCCAYAHVEHIVVGKRIVDGNFFAILAIHDHRHGARRRFLGSEIKI